LAGSAMPKPPWIRLSLRHDVRVTTAE